MTKLSIPDMSGGHCKATGTAALTSVPGVAAVEVDLADRSARVDGNAPLAALLTALDQAGYPATAAD